MMGKTHLSGGLASGLLATQLNIDKILLSSEASTNPINAVALISGSAIGSLLVDIDHINSIAGRKLRIFSIPMNLLQRLFSFLKLKNASKMFGHRGITHSVLLWVVFLVALLSQVNKIDMTVTQNSLIVYFLFGIIVGAFSHLFLDSLTVSGIPVFLPFSFKRFRLLRIRTGTKVEIIVNCFLWVLIAFSVKSIVNISEISTITPSL